TLEGNEGGLAWESEALGKQSVVAFSAFSGNRSRSAAWEIAGHRLSDVALGADADFEREADGIRLCYRKEAERGDKPYGSYFRSGALPFGAPLALRVSFLSGMRDTPIFFVLDRKRPLAELEPLWRSCAGSGAATLVSGVGRLIDASRNSYPQDAGKWRV